MVSPLPNFASFFLLPSLKPASAVSQYVLQIIDNARIWDIRGIYGPPLNEREREKENLMKFPLCEKENPLSVGSILVVGKKGKEREKKDAHSLERKRLRGKNEN